MTRRTEFEPMSMIANGRPTCSRPGARPSSAPERRGRSGALASLGERARARILERLSTSGQARIGHEVLVCVEWLLVPAGPDPLARTGGLYRPALLVVEEVRQHDLVEDLLMHGRVDDRQQGLDAPVEVAGHQVRRGDVDVRLRVRQAVAVAEAVDAGMLQEAPNDRLDADGLRQAGDAGPQAADAPHYEVDLNAGGARAVEGVDDGRVDERVALAPDCRRPAGLGVGRLLRDVLQEALSKGHGRDRHALQLGRLSVAGDEVEYARHVPGDRPVGGE